LVNLGDDLASTYTARDFDKRAEQKLALAADKGDFGLFMVNQALYNLCIRTWKPVRKYIVTDVSSKYEVRLEENKAFADYKALLDLCAQKINERVKNLDAPNPDYIFNNDFILELKNIMNSGGYGYGE